MKNILTIILAALLVSACTKKATIDLPASEEKLVVTCFLNPEDQISAVVRLSKPKFGSQQATAVFQDDVKDAIVTLSDGTKSLVIPFEPSMSFYFWPDQISFPIVPGKTYYLTVTTPDGKKVSANTTVPGDSLTIESMKFPMRKQDSVSFEHDISVVVPDIPNQVNYVLFHFTNHVATRARTNPNFPEFGGEYSWAHFDNDEKTAKFKYYLSTTNSFSSSDTITNAKLDISVLNCSRELYLYNKSVSEGAFSSPFSDPVMIYTNFDNGFGCFGAYRAVHRSHTIR